MYIMNTDTNGKANKWEMKKEKLNKNFMIQSSNGSYVQLLRSNTSARSETGTPTKKQPHTPGMVYSLKGPEILMLSVCVLANVFVCSFVKEREYGESARKNQETIQNTMI